MAVQRPSIIVSALAVLALLVSIVAYSRDGGMARTGVPQGALSKIRQTGFMDVCYAVWPPAVIKDAATGKLSGHDVDAIEKIASQIGAKIRWHETTFGNMSTAVGSGQCDMGTSLFVKIPRAAITAFTRPLFYAGNSGLVRKGETRFSVIGDLDKPGVRVVVANGESGHIYAKEHFTKATIIPIDVASSDLSRFLLEVTSGRADIGIADANTIRLFAAQHPETTDAFAGKPFDLNPDAWPVRSDDHELLQLLNNSLLYMQTNGDWDALLKKYDAHWLQETHQYKVN